MDELPLLRHFPALSALPRAAFGAFPTPVQRLTLQDGRVLLVKRDDRCGASIGGNKLRALEWLLAGVGPGDRVVTVGARGSTHALTTAILAGRLGAEATVVRWNQEMNDVARRVDSRTRVEAARVVDARFVAAAYVIAATMRLRGARWVPAGAASPLAVLGHVNAALELTDQVARNECELPEEIVVPLGTGGTAAGLALGLRIAGLGVRLVGVRVIPRIVARKSRVVRLANDCAALIEQLTGGHIPRVAEQDIVIEHGFYGGAYGRPLSAMPFESVARDAGIPLDDTYSRKAFSAAASRLDHRVLFWLTFDERLLSRG